MRGQTGACVSDWPTWLERDQRYRLQDELTRRIADVLEPAGVPVHRAGRGFALVGLVTGGIKPAEQPYRRIHFLPSVAAALRAELANALELHLATSGRYARYAVMTTGQRCELDELRQRIIRLSRLVSRWHREICAPLGIVVAFRSIELPCDDAKTFHVHANVVYWPTHSIPKRPWRRFLRQTRAYFGAHWKDNGRLKEVREVVKYVMKGDQVAHLADADPAALVALYHQLKGLHLVQPLGPFRTFRRRLDDAGLKVVAEYGPRRRRLVVTRRPTLPHRDLPQGGLPPTNQVLGIDLPRAAFCNYREPVMRIGNLDARTLWHDPQLLARAGEALADWTRNGAPPPQLLVPAACGPFTVHTCTPSDGAAASRERLPALESAAVSPHAPRGPPE
ncbi:MAG TPA: hypothetical protein ENH89_14555 [Aurantimonas coralicida]|uniref:Uncharacterized protein n=1 Tax=Aurantimonas coralicida TaxID=182270 RepID=A0A9C9NHM0_9HYPH|nr:hypothetical protein [Aurantimonas coralicida]